MEKKTRGKTERKNDWSGKKLNIRLCCETRCIFNFSHPLSRSLARYGVVYYFRKIKVPDIPSQWPRILCLHLHLIRFKWIWRGEHFKEHFPRHKFISTFFFFPFCHIDFSMRVYADEWGTCAMCATQCEETHTEIVHHFDFWWLERVRESKTKMDCAVVEI